MQLTAVLTAAVLAGLARAAGPTDSFNSTDLSKLNTTGMPGFVDETIRESWCVGQRSACSTLCGTANMNHCDPNLLTWNCTCASNNSEPGLQWYGSSMPSTLCGQLHGLCLNNTAQDGQAAQMTCNTTYMCSNLNITDFKSSSSGSAASGTAKPSSSATGSSASKSPTPSKSAAEAALHLGEHYGLGLLAVVAGAGLLL